MEISADAIYLGATIEARILVFEIGLRPGPGGAGAQVSLRVGRDCLKLNAVDWIIGGTGELARWLRTLRFAHDARLLGLGGRTRSVQQIPVFGCFRAVLLCSEHLTTFREGEHRSVHHSPW
jgi:hypothetical protein